jgi:DNA-directed RNA polymerase II subunit RPB2
MTKETSAYVRRQFEQGNDISWMDAVRGGTITQGLRYSLATGNWGVQGDANIKPGVAQALNRLTFASTLSHLRRINCPTGREGKNPKPRQLHNSQWGVVCPAETPEGHQVGLVKNLALMAQVTVGKRQEATDNMHNVLVEWGTEEIAEINPTTIHNVCALCAQHACGLAASTSIAQSTAWLSGSAAMLSGQRAVRDAGH